MNDTPECEYCNDEGYIHTCMNCYKPAIYDYEFGIAVCDDCFLLGEKQNVFSEKCSHCNVADIEVEIPKIGERIQYPTAEQINNIINWMFLIKIPFDSSYDIIRPIKIENSTLEYYSYVENKIKHIEFNKIPEIEIVSRTISSVRWSTNLKGLINYVKEERNKDIMNNKQYIRLDVFTGCSWDKNKFNYNDIATKRNIKDSHFANGLTLKVNMLLKNQYNDSFYFDPIKNILYLIESITKFEIL